MKLKLLALSLLFLPAMAMAEEQAELSTGGQVSTLDEAFVSAYATNPDIKTAIAKLESATEELPQAFSGWLPRISGSYSYGRADSRTANDHHRYGTINNKSLDINQQLFNGGETYFGSKKAKNAISAEYNSFQAAEQQVLLDTVTSYMNLVRDQAIMELSAENEKVLQKQLESTRTRFNLGEVTITDVAQAEARLALASADKTTSEGNVISSRAVFRKTVGELPGNLKVPKKPAGLPATLEEAKAAAIENNPGLKSALFREKAAQDDVSVGKSALLPDVSLRGTATRNSNDGGRFSAPDTDKNTVMLNVSVPLYQSGAEYSRVRQAKRDAERRRYEALSTRDQVESDTISSWKNIETTRLSIQANREAVKAAQIALNGVRQEADMGTRTILDVLDAEQELFRTKISLVRAERDEIVAAYNLLGRVGKLTAHEQGLRVKLYDPREYYDRVKYKLIGF